MHGTGTALGDPVEVAAALAAVRPSSAHSSLPLAQRLSLMASKSTAGHCEPAAGLVGLAAAAAALGEAAAAPVLHLRTVNPHVEAAMGGQGRVAVPRAPGGWPSGRGQPPACSISSFAFQVAVDVSAHPVFSCGLRACRAPLPHNSAEIVSRGGMYFSLCSRAVSLAELVVLPVSSSLLAGHICPATRPCISLLQLTLDTLCHRREAMPMLSSRRRKAQCGWHQRPQ